VDHQFITVSNEAQLTGLTNSISVSTNLIKNNNGGNFADGTIAPFTGLRNSSNYS
jgi:hypothetical protein